MDIGNQQRVIIVEPERIDIPAGQAPVSAIVPVASEAKLDETGLDETGVPSIFVVDTEEVAVSPGRPVPGSCQNTGAPNVALASIGEW